MDEPPKLPSQFENQVLAMAEDSYGVVRLIVTLEGGKEFRDVYVAWGREIVKVGDSTKLLFDPSKIVKVRQL